jgi:hypothetical protein
VILAVHTDIFGSESILAHIDQIHEDRPEIVNCFRNDTSHKFHTQQTLDLITTNKVIWNIRRYDEYFTKYEWKKFKLATQRNGKSYSIVSSEKYIFTIWKEDYKSGVIKMFCMKINGDEYW